MARNLFSKFLPPIVGAYNADGLSEAMGYHSGPSNFGYFSILAANAKGNLRQESYRLSLLPEVLPLLNPAADTYLGQHEFRVPNRRVMNLLRICLAWVDLDLNKSDMLTGEPERDLGALFDFHHWNGPMPSVIIYSGVGYHLKWFLEKPIPAQALPRWNAVQTALYRKYAEFGADPQAKDASRVLRLIGTTNRKSGRLARVIYPGPEWEVTAYDFENLALDLLPYERGTIEGWKAARAEKVKEAGQGGRERPARQECQGALNLRKTNLNWDRLGDLRALTRLRMIGNGGTVPVGQRDKLLFWQINFLMLSKATALSLMYHEAAVLAKTIDPCWGYRSEVLSTVYRKAALFRDGKQVEFNGRSYPPLYTPKSQTLIDILEITDYEMAFMRTIITPSEAKRRELARDEARRRKQGRAPRDEYLEAARANPEDQAQRLREWREARRRGQGQAPRDEYLEAAKDRKAQALALKEKGLSYRAIAMEMGVSVASVSDYLKDL